MDLNGSYPRVTYSYQTVSATSDLLKMEHAPKHASPSRRSSLRLQASPQKSPKASPTSARRRSSVSNLSFWKAYFQVGGPALLKQRQALSDMNDNPLSSKPASPSKEGQKSAKSKARKSLGRRVSFAATAHVRLFDKDAEGWNPKNELEDELNKGMDLLPVANSQKIDLQMPDLSSVRRNRYAFFLS